MVYSVGLAAQSATLQKKRKLLFSFASNTVKMCGLVGPAQTLGLLGGFQPKVLIGLAWGQPEKPGKYKRLLRNGKDSTGARWR
jgi:hypothetical protein